MPIVEIEIVGGIPESEGGEAQTLADAIGRVLGSAPANTWVRIRTLTRECYAENETILAPPDLPVFVTVLKRQMPERTELAREITALTQVIGNIVGRRTDRVHIEYAATAAGRMAFGGTLIE
jgi:phenylpyruvate tautomerase PptA (4-oxalocrotonate tautomerase family)